MNRAYMGAYHPSAIRTAKSARSLYRGMGIVWYVLSIVEVVLLFRFILKLFGANPDAGFTSFIYGVTDAFAAPFLNVFHVTYVEGSVLEWTTALAMAVYWFIAFGIIKLLRMGSSVSRYRDEVDQEVAVGLFDPE